MKGLVTIEYEIPFIIDTGTSIAEGTMEGIVEVELDEVEPGKPIELDLGEMDLGETDVEIPPEVLEGIEETLFFKIRWPKIKWPKIRFRWPKRPKASFRVKFPRIRVRVPRIRFKWPRFRWPKIRFPKIRFKWPRIKWPKFKWPKIKWPKIPWGKVALVGGLIVVGIAGAVVAIKLAPAFAARALIRGAARELGLKR